MIAPDQGNSLAAHLVIVPSSMFPTPEVPEEIVLYADLFFAQMTDYFPVLPAQSYTTAALVREHTLLFLDHYLLLSRTFFC